MTEADDMVLGVMQKEAEDREAAASEAKGYLERGEALDYCLSCFHASHIGDRQVGKCLAAATAVMAGRNTNGLYIFLSGESGEGKTHAVETWMMHLPLENRVDGSLSDKALFFHYGDKPGPLMVYIDDKELSPDLTETIKQATSHFQRRTKHYTVGGDRKPQELSLPARTLFIFSKVQNIGDEQMNDRVLMPWVTSNPDHYRDVVESILESAAALPDETSENRDRWIIAEEIIRELLERNFFVSIPFAPAIKFVDVDCSAPGLKFRNIQLFLDLIRAFAIWNYPNRDPEQTREGYTHISANLDDYNDAEKLFGDLSGYQGSQEKKLTKRESALLDEILNGAESKSQIEFTRRDFQERLNWSYDQVRDAFEGSRHEGRSPGLLSKCPAITVYDRTRGAERGEGKDTIKIYAINRERLQKWMIGSPYCLDEELAERLMLSRAPRAPDEHRVLHQIEHQPKKPQDGV